jgi:hypothetical protein
MSRWPSSFAVSECRRRAANALLQKCADYAAFGIMQSIFRPAPRQKEIADRDET